MLYSIKFVGMRGGKSMQVVRCVETTPPGEEALCTRMREDGLSPYSWSNAAGDIYAIHSHGYEKVLYCVRGSIRFVMPDYPVAEQNVDLKAGACLILPPGVRH